MTWDEFYSYVTMQFSSINAWSGDSLYWCQGSSEAFSVQWVTGGVSGGNCWEEGGHYDLEGEPEPSLSDIDTLLESVCSNLSFSKYKQVLAAVIERDDHSVNEYYGNHTNYATITINYRKLYDQLVSVGAWHS